MTTRRARLLREPLWGQTRRRRRRVAPPEGRSGEIDAATIEL